MAECEDSQKVIDIMKCSICLEKYNKPRSLPCLHTFCEGCILTYSTSILEKLDRKEHVNCPVCRATVQLPKKECTPKEFVDQLPVNFFIIGLLEKEKVARKEKLCMICERLDITSNATFICTDCSDTLCDTCQKYHKANKATCNHDIIPVSQLSDDGILPKAFKNICTKHSKNFILFCRDHDVPCCLLCLSVDHRKCDKIISVEEAAKMYCSSLRFEDLQIDLKNVSDDINTLSTHYSQCFRDIETQYKSKLKYIENTCSSLIAKVKDLEITRKTQLAKIFDERKDAVETQMIACENHRKSIDNEKQVLDASLGKASDVQVLIEAQKIASQVEHHKRFLADCSSKHNFEYKMIEDDGTSLAESVEQFVDSMCAISCDSVEVALNLMTDLSFSQVEFIQEENATEEQIKMARKFLLPDHFYLYEEKLPCSGCNGCNDYIPGDLTISHTIENISDLKDCVLSPPYMIRNIPWKIFAMPRTDENRKKTLGVFLHCNGENSSKSWSCKAKATIRILKHDESQPYQRKIQHVFCSKENDWGYSNFISWKDLMEPNNGYVNDNKIRLEIYVNPDKPKGV
ncbi:E3 ubiquitin-protein ligase TRIM45-like [Mytilus edulis]|uniref:E3 ubiquitin-protein ligase TRIM45-like n=1 Tax=Mytilus edulis TaxID=6550 RepID=UPI0039EE143E